jgi:hypothetical protein
MDKSDLLGLLRWLDASKNPVLVQTPLELLTRLDLPESISAIINSR